MNSCLYEGTVTHHRREPVTHHFHYRLFMVYLDLDELQALVGRGALIAENKYARRSFLLSDHLFHGPRSLATAVRDLIEQQTGAIANGPIRLLTQLRYFGFYFSPLNLFYVYDEQDRRVEYVVAEVNNTPWNQRHCYVLWEGNGTRRDKVLRFSHSKQFHVSPFMGMDVEYRWRLNEPNSSLAVQLTNFRDSKQLFCARIKLRRRLLCRQQLRRMTLRYPLMTTKISAAIYYQAFKLWWKRCPFHTHPNKLSHSRCPTPTSSETSTVRTSDER